MEKIPKPVKPFNHSEDLRKKYLNEWKDLFKSIHPEIEVYHYYDDEFNVKLNNRYDLDNVYFSGLLYSNVRILIYLPEELQLSYIIGLQYNFMFSKKQVLEDSFYFEEDAKFPCEPELSSWEKIYLDLCEISEELKKEIPKPKNSKE